MSHPRTSVVVNVDRIAALMADRMPTVADRRAFMVERGVGYRTIANAASRRPLGAEAYLKLCAALEVDPVSLEPAAADLRPWRGMLHWPSFGTAIGVGRNVKGHDQRAFAKAAGVSLATVNRAESGQAVSAGSLLRLAAYLDLHPHLWSVAPDFSAAPQNMAAA